jgi:hypothetical protein
MKILTGYGLLFLTLFCLAACHKTGTSSTTPPSSATLQGNWTIYQYVVANFDTSGGMTPLPNDTIYPTHSEYKDFTMDSVYEVSWEDFNYAFGHPDSFYNVQTREYSDTSAYTATAAYYLEPRFSPNDTTFIIGLTDTTLDMMEKIYVNLNTASGPVLYDIFIYARKQ